MTTVVAGDGHRIGYDVHEPSSPGRSSTTIVFRPALGVPLGYCTPLFEAWTARGRRVIGVENRGQSRSPVAGVKQGRFGYSEMVRRDGEITVVIDEWIDRQDRPDPVQTA